MKIRYAETRTLSRFHASDDFVRCCVGPVGSGKSTACVMELFLRARQQEPGPDKVRRTRFAVIRNTYSQLRDTTRKTFEQWVPSALGKWHEQSTTFTLDYRREDGTRVHSEILFRALDRPEDVKKLLSLELTGAYINEAREIPKHVLDVLQTRVGRYPARNQGGASWFGIWMDTNPWHPGHWASKLFAQNLEGYRLFRQPGGRSAKAENVANLPRDYYERLIRGKDSEWVRVYVDGEDASGDVGSVFGAWVAGLEKRGALCSFDHLAGDIITNWDLGHSDSTGIWFWRVNADMQVDLIDHYEATGQGLSHYFEVIDAKPYKYAQHWLPHDARAKTLATQQTVVEQCVERWGHDKVSIVPNIGLDDGIGAARWLLEQKTRIHERCDRPGRLDYSGVDALREYRFKWDENNQCFSRDPLHNWASHTADALRYLAVVVKHVLKMKAPPPKPPELKILQANEITMDDAWEMHDRERRSRDG